MELSNFPTFPLFLLFVRREQLDSLGSVLTSKTPSYIKYSRVFYLLQERNLPFFRELANLLFFLLDKLLALISSLGATLNLPSLPPFLDTHVPTHASSSSPSSCHSGSGYTFSRSFRGCWQPPSTSYLNNPPLCHTNTRTHFRARTPGCPSEAELIVDCLNPPTFYLPTFQPFGRLW
jgi:hypothetical protein